MMLLTLAVIAPGDACPAPTEPASLAATTHADEQPTRTAGLLVPKRVRLIIKYQRTALA